MVFMPMGFMVSSVGGSKTALPSLSTPFWALDMSDTLSNGRFFTGNTKTPPTVTSYPGSVLSIADMAATDGSYWDLLGATALTANLQNGLPGLALTTTNNILYAFGGSEDISNNMAKLENNGTAAAPFTVMVIMKFTTLPTGTAQAPLFACAGWGAVDASTALVVYAKSDGFYFQRGAASYAAPVKVAATLSTSTLYKVVARYNPGVSMRLAVNALTPVSQTPTGTIETNTWSLINFLALGYNNAVQTIAAGNFFEGRVWGSYCTDAQEATLLQYATDKWGS